MTRSTETRHWRRVTQSGVRENFRPRSRRRLDGFRLVLGRMTVNGDDWRRAESGAKDGAAASQDRRGPNRLWAGLRRSVRCGPELNPHRCTRDGGYGRWESVMPAGSDVAPGRGDGLLLTLLRSPHEQNGPTQYRQHGKNNRHDLLPHPRSGCAFVNRNCNHPNDDDYRERNPF